MQFPKLLIFFFFLFTVHATQAQDYTQYHTAIIKAEEEIFLNNQPAKGLEIYSATFNKYDFVFVQDCVNAMQIALYIQDSASFFKFTTKAAQNGILMRHLDFIKYISSNQTFTNNRERIRKIIAANRQHYLKRLDTTALKEMYSLYAWDQMEKNPLKYEDEMRYNIRYKPKIETTMKKLRALIQAKGFPSDKLIGIDQTDIQKELRTGSLDLLGYYKKYKDYKNMFNIRPGQFEREEYLLASTLYYPIAVHYAHVFHNFYPFDQQLLLNQIGKGMLHPKDAAIILDMPFVIDQNTKADTSRNQLFFASWVILMNPKPHPFGIKDSYVDKCRAKYFIAPVAQDRAKYKFMKEKGMWWEWGYMGWRS